MIYLHEIVILILSVMLGFCLGYLYWLTYLYSKKTGKKIRELGRIKFTDMIEELTK